MECSAMGANAIGPSCEGLAKDSAGEMQPFAIDWNPKGYLNNTMHRVGLRVS